MHSIRRHVTRCFVAGIVALLPLVSLVLTIVYFENQVAVSWLKDSGIYFFGLGLIIAIVLIYVVGFAVTNFIGRWLWKLVDRLVDNLPILGSIYQTVKQLLGYGEGPGAFFQRVVFVASNEIDGEQLGLVTNENPFPDQPDQIAVFIPTAPSPASGRLIYIESKKVRDSSMSVNQAMKSLVSVGSAEHDDG